MSIAERAVVAVLLGGAALAGCPKGATPVASVPTDGPSVGPAIAPIPNGPALVVLVVVDQLPLRLLETPQDRYTAGLARLTDREQAAQRVARYAHAITYTCPGHATISTGASPSVTGIVSNDWVLPGTGGAPATKVYCGDAGLLRVGTLADRVVEAGGSVAAVALKDRAAEMLGGVKPTLKSWYDKGIEPGDEGGPVAPAFTGALSGVDLAPWFRPWEPLYPDDYLTWVGPDAGPLENDQGLGVVFPHPVPTGKQFLYTPFAGDALVDASLAAVDRLGLGQGGPPDLLALSFSQTDYIGHAFTTESWEAMDAMVRLDLQLGRLMDGLSQRIGSDRFTVLLTSDHGSFRASRTTVRLTEQQVIDAANAALKAGDFVGEVTFESPSLWLPPAIRGDPRTRARASVAVADAIRAVPGIGGAYPWRDVPPAGPHGEAVKLSLDDERSGDVYVMRAADALYSYPGSEGKGTSHGTPFSEDAEVPFLAWGAGIQPGKGAPVEVRQVAPTAAVLLGVLPPVAAKLPPDTTMLAR